MAMGKKGPKMDSHVMKKLLDGLTKDEAFRKKFQESPDAALASIGYVVPAGETSAAGCLKLAAGEKLASADSIAAARPKLEAAMVGIFGFDCPAALKG